MSGTVHAAALGFFQPKAAGGVGLRVEIQQQNFLAERGKAGGEVDGGRGLAHAAFLIGYCDNFGRHANGVSEVAREFKEGCF